MQEQVFNWLAANFSPTSVLLIVLAGYFILHLARSVKNLQDQLNNYDNKITDAISLAEKITSLTGGVENVQSKVQTIYTDCKKILDNLQELKSGKN